jgi:hypothetical protein
VHEERGESGMSESCEIASGSIDLSGAGGEASDFSPRGSDEVVRQYEHLEAEGRGTFVEEVQLVRQL